jgi:hypothetical protein
MASAASWPGWGRTVPPRLQALSGVAALELPSGCKQPTQHRVGDPLQEAGRQGGRDFADHGRRALDELAQQGLGGLPVAHRARRAVGALTSRLQLTTTSSLERPTRALPRPKILKSRRPSSSSTPIAQAKLIQYLVRAKQPSVMQPSAHACWSTGEWWQRPMSAGGVAAAEQRPGYPAGRGRLRPASGLAALAGGNASRGFRRRA